MSGGIVTGTETADTGVNASRWVEPDGVDFKCPETGGDSLTEILQRQIAFSKKTFGPGHRPEGLCDHIRKELDEIAASPYDLEEWIDVVILALDGAWRTGATPEMIVGTLISKQMKNEERQWPDWRTAEPGKAIEHIKAKESVLTEAARVVNGERQDSYGSPENSFPVIASYWQAYVLEKIRQGLSRYVNKDTKDLILKTFKKDGLLEDTDAANMLILFKQARKLGQKPSRDNSVDSCGYESIYADMLMDWEGR